jgi:hypothetical protein
MAIPQWLTKTASEVKDATPNLSSPTWDEIVEQYKAGKLNPWSVQVVEEVLALLGVVDTAIAALQKQKDQPESLDKPMDKKAAPTKEKEKAKPADDAPFDFGDDRLKEEMTPEKEDKDVLPGSVNRKLPPKMKEPETTKWKEIRFNKRTGTWQVVVTIRHTRNFLSEDEAVDFTKKASQNEKM